MESRRVVVEAARIGMAADPMVVDSCALNQQGAS